MVDLRERIKKLRTPVSVESTDHQWYSQLRASYSKPLGRITDWPSGKFNTIYVDPPWPFVDRINPSTRGAAAYYGCLSVEQIKGLRVADLASGDCLLWLWVPRLFRRFGEEVIEAWGFVPKTEWIWVKTTLDGTKVRGGMGHYNRMAHEYLMLGTRGSARPLNGRSEVSVVLAPRRKHSEKPTAFYELIERNSLEPRVELFARARRRGWSSWGDQLK